MQRVAEATVIKAKAWKEKTEKIRREAASRVLAG